jgi:hypothetical protein
MFPTKRGSERRPVVEGENATGCVGDIGDAIGGVVIDGGLVAIAIGDGGEIAAVVKGFPRAIREGHRVAGLGDVRLQRGVFIKRRCHRISGARWSGLEGPLAAVAEPVLNRPRTGYARGNDQALVIGGTPTVAKRAGTLDGIDAFPLAVPGAGDLNASAQSGQGVVRMVHVNIAVGEINGQRDAIFAMLAMARYGPELIQARCATLTATILSQTRCPGQNNRKRSVCPRDCPGFPRDSRDSSRPPNSLDFCIETVRIWVE